VAAQLEDDARLDVTRQRGRLGELTVQVDDARVVDSHWYPSPSSIVERVKAHVGRATPAA
jgi:hypothetical protein